MVASLAGPGFARKGPVTSSASGKVPSSLVFRRCSPPRSPSSPSPLQALQTGTYLPPNATLAASHLCSSPEDRSILHRTASGSELIPSLEGIRGIAPGGLFETVPCRASDRPVHHSLKVGGHSAAQVSRHQPTAIEDRDPSSKSIAFPMDILAKQKISRFSVL